MTRRGYLCNPCYLKTYALTIDEPIWVTVSVFSNSRSRLVRPQWSLRHDPAGKFTLGSQTLEPLNGYPSG
jgi:hypothetical protein